jgi:uncharacterized damage-inducible protein DinB
MTTAERAMPPLQADERTTLESWLDFYRATLITKCEGLSDEQPRTAPVPPSRLTLLGLVQHMAEVERNWFRRVLLGEEVPPIYSAEPDPSSRDGGFDLAEDATLPPALATWQAETTQARANCAGRDLDETSPFMGSGVTLRWIYSHMIGEYARHAGHADLIRANGSTARPAREAGLAGVGVSGRRAGSRPADSLMWNGWATSC